MKGLIYVIEFQKRGVPHAHILAILNRVGLIHPDEIEKYTVAEIPNRILDLELWTQVTQKMIHNPCGSFNPESPCCKYNNGTCKHRYPKPYSSQSYFSEEDGSPIYRRRSPEEGGQTHSTTFVVNNHDVEYELSNKDVVPYNPWLLRMFDCHINVEICSSLKVIKYLLWYPFKGDTRVIASIDGPEDEITMYEDMRTVGSTEALWKLYHFSMHERYPSVVSLNIHLKNDQQIYYEDATNLVELLQSGVKYTPLEAFFVCNTLNPGGMNKDLTFLQFPTKFTFNRQSHIWTQRKYHNTGIKKEQVGRFPLLTPQHGDVFYLRILLAHDHSKGKTSFDHMKIVHGILHNSYRDVCFTLGLIDDEDEWKECLNEIYLGYSSKRFREVFAMIIAFNSPVGLCDMIEFFYENLVEDISKDCREHGIDVEPVTFFYVSVYLLEQELKAIRSISDENMDNLGMPIITDIQRDSAVDLLDQVRLAKQMDGNMAQDDSNPYKNMMASNIIQEIAKKKVFLTNEQKKIL